MPSVIQKKSYGSVMTFWLDKGLVNKNVHLAVEKILSKRKEIEDVILFGSFVEQKATVTSDVDILLIIKDSDKTFIDRHIDYMDFFQDIGLTVDLFVYTREEVKKGIPLVERALSQGIRLSLPTKL